MSTEEIIRKLAAPFGKEQISWRAQSLTKDGTKALALAYIDARDVMNRLDAVVGASNWQDSYFETPSKRVICTLSLKLDGEWVSKSDGAGDTAVESEKGGISDSFKRAAVKWGIGRHLYDLDSPFVPCETYTNSQGKKVFSKFTVDPFTLVKNMPIAKPEPKELTDAEKREAAENFVEQYLKELASCKNKTDFYALKNDKKKTAYLDKLKVAYPDLREIVHNKGVEKASELDINAKDKS